MRSWDIKTGIVKWRALLIISALITLCVSDSVGPRFLPLPVSQGITASAQELLGIEPAASQLPSPVKGSSPRIEMAVTAQNRAGAGHHNEQVAAHNPAKTLGAPAHIVLDIIASYGPLLPFTAPVTTPPGRGPPRLV